MESNDMALIWKPNEPAGTNGKHGADGPMEGTGARGVEVVMAADEAPYMEKLAAVVAQQPGGRVLEIGFGMGISARYIQQRGTRHHVVVEPNYGVFDSALKHAAAYADKYAASPILGFWQEVLPLLRDGSFDGALYDAFPDVVTPEFLREARRLLRPGGVLSFYWVVCDPRAPSMSCGTWDEAKLHLYYGGWLPSEVESATTETITLDIRRTCSQWPDCPLETVGFLVPTVRKVVALSEADEVSAGYVPPVCRLEHKRQVQGLEQKILKEQREPVKLSSRDEWQQAKILPTGDTSLVIEGAGTVVMDTEETDNMGSLARIAARSQDEASLRHGRVLEIGFGMGISAAALQREGLSLHVIIEANTAVMRRLLQSDLYRNRSDGHVVPVLGFWEEMVLVLGDDVFDGILLDPFPVGEWMPDGPEYQRPFMHHAHRMLKPGGVFTYMSGLSTTKEEIATTVNTDRTAALEAGFRAEDVKIDVEMHAMVDHCPAWPDCAKTMLPMLAPRLVKARSA